MLDGIQNSGAKTAATQPDHAQITLDVAAVVITATHPCRLHTGSTHVRDHITLFEHQRWHSGLHSCACSIPLLEIA
jgi:hypothetical protein